MVDDKQRAPRSEETRERTHRMDHWAAPEVLPEPEKHPGWVYRWIRTSTLGVADPMNISTKTREGWDPVDINEQPALKLHKSQDPRFKGNIEIGGLLLCKMPEEFAEQRRQHFANVTNSQMVAVDNNFLKESDPRSPLFMEKKSTVSFGSGSR